MMSYESNQKNDPAISAIRAVGMLNHLAKLSEKPFLPYERALKEDVMVDDQVVFYADGEDVQLFTAYPVLSFFDECEVLDFFETDLELALDSSSPMSVNAYVTRIVDGEYYGYLNITLDDKASIKTSVIIENGTWTY